MPIKFCFVCEKECEKPDFFRHLKTIKRLLKTGIKQNVVNVKKILSTEEKSHEIQREKKRF